MGGPGCDVSFLVDTLCHDNQEFKVGIGLMRINVTLGQEKVQGGV